MKTMDRSIELDTALCAVARACVAAMGVRKEMAVGASDAIVKEDKSPVTVADFAAQAVVAATLEHAFAGDALVGEESSGELVGDHAATVRARVAKAASLALGRDVREAEALRWIDRGASLGDSDRYWVLDPVDGTKGFLRGGQFAVALALVEQGQVVAAALGCPAYEANGLAMPGLLLGATLGGGAFELPVHGYQSAVRRPLRVATGIARSRWRMCESVESGHTDQGLAASIVAELGIGGASLRMDSQAKYAAVARGDAELYLRLPTRKDYREKVWDHAAGALVVTEAGGVVTDVDGRALDFSHGRALEGNRGVIASVGGDHDLVLAAVKRALG